MSWGLDTFKDVAEFISFIVTSLSLAAIYFTYLFSKKQIHFATIGKCVADYRELYSKYEDKSENPKFLDQYLDLVNEELFYIEKKYLPKEVAIEWIDGMIDYLPFIHNDHFIESKKFNQLKSIEKTQEQLYSYPRILKFITIHEEINFEEIYLKLLTNENAIVRNVERHKLIRILIKNVR